MADGCWLLLFTTTGAGASYDPLQRMILCRSYEESVWRFFQEPVDTRRHHLKLLKPDDQDMSFVFTATFIAYAHAFEINGDDVGYCLHASNTDVAITAGPDRKTRAAIFHSKMHHLFDPYLPISDLVDLVISFVVPNDEFAAFIRDTV